jgi:hypothetical protein
MHIGCIDVNLVLGRFTVNRPSTFSAPVAYPVIISNPIFKIVDIISGVIGIN